ncbi:MULTISPECIES: hypothetical protein [Micromonospora]|uniref:Uncharacterized protein n=2 Tax=Micromonospora TaxID=1873 RepID=A0A1C6SGX6_9ACTN|nr:MULTISPECIES: hypothetical protein [Micromonospora]TWJ29820.1 hypothetical protein JD81_03351 [Micromonospora sagamiensis]BCL17151.1 hypothetical protein GCM10017556_48900 [Micromonospora sagamiensis]SCL28608.1 hypothetical protein GA0074694_5160 [Micromonospora inyonensis]
MSEPEESQDDVEPTERIEAPPTANPTRVQVPPEGPAALPENVRPADPGPAEEA